MKFRKARDNDRHAIQTLFAEVFTAAENAAEGESVSNLAYELMTTTPESDVTGFVATKDAQLIGCIIFSRLEFNDSRRAFILSPVAVHTEHQRQGIGQQLIETGISDLASKGVDLIMTYGDPAFYGKCGFQPVKEATIPAPHKLSQPEGWLGRSLKDGSLVATIERVQCVEALNRSELW